MSTYNGHKNWTHWNVSLWLGSDEDTYGAMVDTVRTSRTLDEAARYLCLCCLPERTPDGARYSQTAVRAALRGMRAGGAR